MAEPQTLEERVAMLEDSDVNEWLRLRCLEEARKVLSWRYQRYSGGGSVTYSIGGGDHYAPEAIDPDELFRLAERMLAFATARGGSDE